MLVRFALPIRIAAALAWLVALVDVSPWWFDLPADQGLFVIAAACVLSHAVIAQWQAQPAHELFKAGIEEGRRQMAGELSCDKVARLSDRRRLQVVSGGGAGQAVPED